MHGNSSSRLEALPQLSLVLHIGATLLTFDFAGSGQSDGEYVSLGAFERDDLQASQVFCAEMMISVTNFTYSVSLSIFERLEEPQQLHYGDEVWARPRHYFMANEIRR